MPSTLDLECTSEVLAIVEKELRVGRFEGLELVLEGEVRGIETNEYYPVGGIKTHAPKPMTVGLVQLLDIVSSQRNDKLVNAYRFANARHIASSSRQPFSN